MKIQINGLTVEPGNGGDLVIRVDTDTLNALSEAARKIDETRRAVEAATPRKGKVVEVFKGRKVPRGTRGKVIWLGDGDYGARVGIKDASGAVHWTAASNVRVLFGATA
jgi:hypothetical protein